jgi:aldehyde:ferredoxin oxidoreductase
MSKKPGGDSVYGYTGNLLRIDLTTGRIATEKLDPVVLRQYLGGAGLGLRLLYDEVPPSAKWSDPDNRFIIATGPLNGTAVGGSGCFTVVTKGALTEGAGYAEASGFLGAFLKFCGFDVILVQGKAEKLSYLNVYEGGAELRDASALAKKDTWETERFIKEELGTGGHQSSVFSIGPAGENGVRFACLVGDKGHVAAHNGLGAVLGSKNLKAIAVERAKGKVSLSDGERFSTLAKKMYEKATGSGARYQSVAKWGTMGPGSQAKHRMQVSRLPIKNQTTNLWSGGDEFSEETVRAQPYFDMKRASCWACRFDHCHSLKITDGPYAGYEGDEPEYELWTGFGPLIGNEDWAGMAVLSNDADRLGIDGNEASWMVAWVMECYEKGLFDRETLDGLEMHWGNVEAARELLRKIAFREGIGDMLAEGVKRSAERVGGDAQKLAVYTGKGNTPRMHDHRATWSMMLDTVTSDRGRDADVAMIFNPTQVGLPAELDMFSPEGAARALAKVRGTNAFPDCLVVCRFNLAGSNEDIAELVNAATGWSVNTEELQQIARRLVNLGRLFNVRHGLTSDMEYPSARYGSAPVDGAHLGKTITPVWKETLTRYYELMGWDREMGKPLPETIASLGLPEN